MSREPTGGATSLHTPETPTSGRLQQPTDDALDTPITRRRALGTAMGTAAALALPAGTLAACGDSSSGSEAPSKPKRGGTLTVGMISGGSTETLNPSFVLSGVDVLRSYQLFDRLFETYDDVQTVRPSLALRAEHNEDASAWTLHLRPEVTWHDGSPFTADDVVWTFRTWSSVNSYANQFLSGLVDFPRVRKLDKLTVSIPLLTPVAELPSLFTEYNMGVVKDGSDKKSFERPVGTGPFKFQSFTPGSESIFVANREYWQHPYPYLDQVTVNSTFTDEAARLNALLSGAINAMPAISGHVAKQYERGNQVRLLRHPSPSMLLFTMRVDKGIFADVRVRQALRLVADRSALIHNALSGYGSAAHDLMGKGTPHFAADLTRPHDVEQARSLLKAAGQEGMAFKLPTTAFEPGYVESATLLAQQAKLAGFKPHIDVESASNYFTKDYLTRPIGQDGTIISPSLTMLYRTFFVAGGGYNSTHWGEQEGGEAAQKLLNEAIGAVDPAKAADLWHEVQLQQFETGGQLAWCNRDSVDLVASNVWGLKSGPSYQYNNSRLLTGWIA